MKTGTKAGIGVLVIIILLVVVFVIPVVSYSSTDSSLFGAFGQKVTAQVSISYALFQCGYVYNPVTTSSVLGYTSAQETYPSGFHC